MSDFRADSVKDDAFEIYQGSVRRERNRPAFGESRAADSIQFSQRTAYSVVSIPAAVPKNSVARPNVALNGIAH